MPNNPLASPAREEQIRAVEIFAEIEIFEKKIKYKANNIKKQLKIIFKIANGTNVP